MEIYREFIENNDVMETVFEDVNDYKEICIKRKLTDSLIAIYIMTYCDINELPIDNYNVNSKLQCHHIVDLKGKRYITFGLGCYKKIDGYTEVKLDDILSELCLSLDKKIFDYYNKHFDNIQIKETNINGFEYYHLEKFVTSDDLSIYLDADKEKYELLKSIYGSSRKWLFNATTNLCIEFLENHKDLEKRLFDYAIKNEDKYVYDAINQKNYERVGVRAVINSKEFDVNREIYMALKSIPDAKKVNIVIKVNDDILEFKYDVKDLKRSLIFEQTTSGYGASYAKVKEFLKDKRTYKDFGYKYDEIFFTDIVKITHGKKVVYYKDEKEG